MRPVVIMSTTPDQQTASKIAEALVEGKFAACVQVIPAITSFYRWKGKLEESGESLLLAKTSRERAEELIDKIERMHPYEVPEVIVLEAVGGAAKYLKWVQEETRK
jgi:periplasmic divalent cation tolerance protein